MQSGNSGNRDDRQKREQQREEKELAKFAQLYAFCSLSSINKTRWMLVFPEECIECVLNLVLSLMELAGQMLIESSRKRSKNNQRSQESKLQQRICLPRAIRISVERWSLASPKWPLPRYLTSTPHFVQLIWLYGSKGYCACILVTLNCAWACLLLLQKQHFFHRIPKEYHVYMLQIMWRFWNFVQKYAIVCCAKKRDSFLK